MTKLNKDKIKSLKKAYKNTSGIAIETKPVNRVTNTPFVNVSYKEYKSPDELKKMKKDY